jgi:transposase
VVPEANVATMTQHLEVISKAVAENAHAVILLDGAGYHRSVRLRIPDNLTLIRLPRYAPELNSAENNWEYLRKNKLSNIIFKTYEDIVDKACEAWRFFAANTNAVTSITQRDWIKVK